MGLRSVSYPTLATQLLRLSGKPLQHCCHDGWQRRDRSCIAMEADITLWSMSVMGIFRQFGFGEVANVEAQFHKPPGYFPRKISNTSTVSCTPCATIGTANLRPQTR